MAIRITAVAAWRSHVFSRSGDENGGSSRSEGYEPGPAIAALSSAGSAQFGLMAGGMRRALSARAPHIDAGEQEQPDHVDEMPIPGGEFEAEMLGRSEVSELSADQANDQERRADDHVRAVESRRHEEGGAVDIAAEIEPRVAVLVGLHTGEREAERDGQDQAPLEPLPVILQERMVGP